MLLFYKQYLPELVLLVGFWTELCLYMSPISVPISHSKHVKSLILTTHHPPTHIQTAVWNVWLLCYDPISLYCSSTHVIQKRHIQSTFWSLQSDAPSWRCEPKTSVKGPFPCKYSIMSFFNCKWHPLMAFIVSYTFACYSRSTSIIYEHTADIFFLSMSFHVLTLTIKSRCELEPSQPFSISYIFCLPPPLVLVSSTVDLLGTFYWYI